MDDEQELPPITISFDDIQEANQLSLHCPICANAVENHVEDVSLQAVLCAKCGTLYHRACWELGGNKCAVLGCNHEKYHVHGIHVSPVLSINKSDLGPAVPSRNGARNKQLKHEQRRQVERMRRPGLFQRLWQWLLDQIKIG